MILLTVILILILILIVFRPKYRDPIVIKNFLDEEICDYIINVSEPQLRPSTVGKESIIDQNIRISDTVWLPHEDPVVKNVLEKCQSLHGKKIENCEKLQVLRYKPGGFYKPHQDAFESDTNKRIYTCILALNDDYIGGETVFPNINKKFKLSKGDLLFFPTLDTWGFITPKALHGGKPVIEGEKWICNIWTRRYTYHLKK